LIPVHPLDGGKVLVGLLSPETGRQVDLFLNRYGLILLFLLIIPTFGGNSILSLIINPIIGFVMNILLPGAAMI
jgi:Zn-dependent protease